MKRVPLFMAAIFTATTAMGHQSPSGWSYSTFCCNGTDCDQIPTESVKAISGGYQVTLNVGDHHSVTRSHVFKIEQSKVKQSQDEFYHACMWPNEDTLRCLYVPHMGY